MRVKLFTFRYSATLGGFDDRPLIHFVRDKEVLSFREHFFTVNDVPHLVCVLSWQEAVVPSAALETTAPPPRVAPEHAPIAPPREEEPRRRKRGRAPDPTAGLDEPQRLLFNTLRE